MDGVTRARRYLRRLPPFSPLRHRYRWSLAALLLCCTTLLLLAHLGSDTNITIARFDTKIYNERFLDDDDLIDVKPKGELAPPNPPRRWRESKVSYAQAEGFNNSLFRCERLRRVRTKALVASGLNSIMYSARTESESRTDRFSIRIVSKKCPSISACLSQDTTTSSEVLVDCDTLSDDILSHEARLLEALRHPSVAPVLNLCRRRDGSPRAGARTRVGTQVMVLEEARPLDMTKLLEGEWGERVKNCLDLGTPADVIKTRVMNQPTEGGRGVYYKSTLDCLVKSIKKEGTLSLYKGFFPIWSRMAPWSITFWTTYEKLRKISGLETF